MKKQITSGDVKYDVDIRMKDLTLEQAKSDAFKYYIWKVQRVIRDASDTEREAWAENGLNMHWSEVGKKVETTEQLVGKMSDDQAKEAFEMLRKKLSIH